MSELTSAPSAPQTLPNARPDISALAKEINAKLASMLSSARTTLQRAIEVGELLNEAKGRVGHGNFEAWVADHCQLSYRSARRYMKLATDREKIEQQTKVANVASLNVAGAQRLLSPPKSAASGQGKPTQSSATKYKQIETDLVECLKQLRDKAESYAAGTVEALNDTVADIKGVIEQRRMP
jgi:hypothetical protein